MEWRNALADRVAPVEILKSEKNIAENRKAVGNLLRRTFGIHENSDHLEKNRNTFSVYLGSKPVIEWQLVKHKCHFEALSVFISEQQLTQPHRLLVCTRPLFQLLHDPRIHLSLWTVLYGIHLM